MKSPLFKGSIVAVVAGLVMACSSANTASAQTRFRYNNNAQINSNQMVPRANYSTRTYIAPNGQRYVSPSNRAYSQVTPNNNWVQPGYRNSQNIYSQPYRSGYRGSTTVYPNYNTYPNYQSGYGNVSPGYYPAPGFAPGYQGYVNQGQQRGANVGGAIGGANGGNRGGNIGAAIGAAVGQ